MFSTVHGRSRSGRAWGAALLIAGSAIVPAVRADPSPAGKPGARIVYASDLHGNLHLYRRLLLAALAGKADAVVLGGDLLPSPEPGPDHARIQTAWIDRALAPLLAWYAAREGPPVLVVPGNHDTVPGMQALCRLPRIVSLVGRPYELGGHTFVGFGHVPPAGFFTVDFERLDSPGDSYGLALRTAWVSGPSGMRAVSPAHHLGSLPPVSAELHALAWPRGKVVLVAHAPPFGTPLDVMKGPRHVGSRSIRDFIMKKQPVLTLHGHIHESPALTGAFRTNLGSSLCLNAGQAELVLYYLVIDLDPGAGQPAVRACTSP